MKELSIFIDESGDFGEATERPAYYLVTLLFHDQKNKITGNVNQKYRLLQAADFICSMELLKIKKNENRLSKSEKQFFL